MSSTRPVPRQLAGQIGNDSAVDLATIFPDPGDLARYRRRLLRVRADDRPFSVNQFCGKRPWAVRNEDRIIRALLVDPTVERIPGKGHMRFRRRGHRATINLDPESVSA